MAMLVPCQRCRPRTPHKACLKLGAFYSCCSLQAYGCVLSLQYLWLLFVDSIAKSLLSPLLF